MVQQDLQSTSLLAELEQTCIKLFVLSVWQGYPGNTANGGTNKVVTNTLSTPVSARYVRLSDFDSVGYPSLRWEIWGCLLTN